MGTESPGHCKLRLELWTLGADPLLLTLGELVALRPEPPPGRFLQPASPVCVLDHDAPETIFLTFTFDFDSASTI